MGTYFKKDFLVYWRDRKEILIALILPLILILILSLAMPNWIENTSKPIDLTVAFVLEDDEELGMQSFKEAITKLTFSEEAKQSMVQHTEQLSPIMMIQKLLQDEQIVQVMKVQEMDRETALQNLQDKKVVAIITVPEDYTLDVLTKWFLSEGNGGELVITAQEANTQFDIVHGIIAEFAHTVNFHSAIGKALLSQESRMSLDASLAALDKGNINVGGREEIPGVRTITAFQYFSLAIGILFALFIAVTTSQKAATEKREQVLPRILLAGARPTQYLFGKASSTFCLSVLQIMIIVLVIHFIMNVFPERTLQFWVGLSLLLIALALCFASLAALFTSLVFRMKDDTANSIILIFLIIFGTIGGGFIPLYILPDWLRDIGAWTPNGLALTASIQWLQTENFADLVLPVIQLIGYAVVSTTIGILIFPRRGQIG